MCAALDQSVDGTVAPPLFVMEGLTEKPALWVVTEKRYHLRRNAIAYLLILCDLFQPCVKWKHQDHHDDALSFNKGLSEGLAPPSVSDGSVTNVPVVCLSVLA